MAYAYCDNAECGKDRWWLTKPPSDYADGGPSCPECGTTRVTIGGDAASADTTTAETAQPARTADAEGARREKQSTDAPATREDSGDESGQLPQTAVEAAEAGEKVADLVAGIGGSSPEEQADATERIATAGGAMVAKLGQRAAQQQRENAQRAQNATQDDISRVEDYVSCPACSTQITDLPPAGERFRCPGCNELLESEG